MHAHIFSATTIGIDAHLVEVEADLSFGLVKFFIVGLPDKAINESRDRIKAALKNSGLRLPQRLITVNLAPAHLKKEGVLFDVPIAIAILQAAGLIDIDQSYIDDTIVLGELALDGKVRPVSGVLSIAHDARKLGKKRLIIPAENVAEAAAIADVEAIGISSLADLVAHFRGEQVVAPTPHVSRIVEQKWQSEDDFTHVKGQFQAKRALQIAAAGGHNVVFIGPPGSGKTMLAKRLATILPPLTDSEALETTKVYSISGKLSCRGLVTTRPFRSPHHTISQAGLVGGGNIPQPGEISLAHNGVLFLDELTEFKRSTLEVLRQPLEHQKVLIARANMAVEFPARFMLIAALNPCPCGYYGDSRKECCCSQKQIENYVGRLSGPLLDRIDLHVHVPSMKYDDVKGDKVALTQSSAQLYVGVQAARVRQQERSAMSNALLGAKDIERSCAMTPAAEHTIRQAFDALQLSMRAYHKILKIARTIADIGDYEQVDAPHIREALMYRSLDLSATRAV